MAGFTVQSLLGEGAMGQVFLAEADGREVALKYLNPDSSLASQESLRREVELLSRLSHPHLVRILDFFPEDRPFFSMEYVPGFALDEWPGRSDAVQAVRVFLQLVQGLNYLHAQGVLHRDLKPSNIRVTPEGEAKILDFGFSSSIGADHSAVAGTIRYLPPEAYAGRYGPESDLFSIGAVFYEALTGRPPFTVPLSAAAETVTPPEPLRRLRPDLPDYFCDLIHQLLDLAPARRPSSARAVLRYLEEHGAERLRLSRKIPFIGREAEKTALLALPSRALREGRPLFLRLTGPTGVGRSRVLEETKWQHQLQGVTALAVPPERSSSWKDWIRDRPPSEPLVLHFSDLQEWETDDLRDLSVFLAKLRRSRLPRVAVLEESADASSEASREFFEGLEAGGKIDTLALRDLSPSESLELLSKADFEKKLSPERAKKISEESGGRPWLLLQALDLGEAGGKKADLDSVCAARVLSLSAMARRLFARVCARAREVSVEEAGVLPDWDRALEELESKGLLASREEETAALKLAHPALRPAFVKALGDLAMREAHRAWIDETLPRAEGGSVEALIPLAEHAFAAGDAKILRKWGVKAAERKLLHGRNAEAAAWFEKLLSLAETPDERVLLNAHLAPVAFRLGRFDDALKAYDRWFSERVDDETHLQKLKYLYYTGLVLFTAGRLTEAGRRLREGAAMAETAVPSAHRPYQTRLHCALAAVLEKENRWEESRRALEKALAFAGADNALLGEVEQLFGRLEQRDFQYISAVRHFARSRDHFAKAGNAHAEAAARHAEGMAHRDAGDLNAALEGVTAAAETAKKGGDVLQNARYTENLGLIQMERGDYGAARAAFEEAGDVLEALARPEDRETVELLRATFSLRIGRFDRCRDLLEKLSKRPSFAGPDTRFQISLLNAERLEAEGAHEDARKAYESVLHDLEKGFGLPPILRLSALLGVCRNLAALGRVDVAHPVVRDTLALLDCLSGDVFAVWNKAVRFFASPESGSGAATEADVRDLMALVRKQASPAVRADLYRLLAVDLRRRGFSSGAAALNDRRLQELRTIAKTLPEENLMDFEKAFQKNLEIAPSRPEPAAPPSAAGAAGQAVITESRFRQYGQINRYISQNRPLEDILERVMDAAVELTGAERGFLLLQDAGASEDAPFPGYDVKAARHLSRRGLKQKEFQLSLSAVRKAMESGTYLLTDDAQLDPRLKSQQSVMIHQLKSILVMPMDLEDETIGVLYLDHPFRQGTFSPESVLLLSALASQAALAIQKTGLIEALKRSQEQLEARVQDQSVKIESMAQELTQMRDQLKFGYEDIVGRSPAILKVFQLLDHVTDTAIPVWIYGESGTGKELIARALHFNSPRKGKPFVAENCSAIPETLLESELFGHKKGAFTHADRDRVGLFEQANGGTLFLDEIGDMSLPMQAKLLRVLQEGEIRPLGSSKTVKVDVRLVTASNKDLARLVAEGKFRQDLFFRVNGLTVPLPPLRERKEDIPLLAEHFVRKFAQTMKLDPSEISDGALRLLLQHPWPGNIRELEGVLRTALLFAKGRPILPEHLNLNLPAAAPSGDTSAKGMPKSEEESAERQMILDALKAAHLSKEAAAKKLGMGLRTLYTRMGQLGLPKKKALLAKYLGLS